MSFAIEDSDLVLDGVGARVARSPVFYGRSRISDPFFRLPGGEAAGKNKSPVFC